MTNPLNGRPNNDHAPVYGAYYMEITDRWTDLEKALSDNLTESLVFFRKIPADRMDFRYLPEKWSTKEIILHMIEAERVFQYRCLRFSRFDSTELSGFNEDFYVERNNCTNRSIESILSEFEIVRKSSIILFQGMTDEMLDFVGHANQSVASARSLGWMIVGHTLHHCAIIKERYLKQI